MTTGGQRLLEGRDTELLLDLVIVFALTRFSQRLIEDYTTDRRILLPEVGQTALLLLALWLVWFLAALVTSRHDPRQPVIQLVLIWVMFGTMIIAVTLPHAFGARALVFVLAYVAIQLGRPLLLMLSRHAFERHNPVRSVCWGAVSAVPWIAGAALFPQSPERGALWALAIGLDYAGLILGWPLPGLGRTRIEDWRIVGEHLAERYQQFIIITVGETILLTGLTFAGNFTRERALPTVASFAAAVLIWRIYFHRAGAVLPTAIEAAPRPARYGRSEMFTQLVIVIGILGTGVGQALVIREPLGHLDPLWLAAIFGGPALFLAGRARLEYDVFARVSASRVVGLIALAALTPVMVHLPPLVASSTVAVVLAGVAAWDAVIAWKHPNEEPKPPR